MGLEMKAASDNTTTQELLRTLSTSQLNADVFVVTCLEDHLPQCYTKHPSSVPPSSMCGTSDHVSSVSATDTASFTSDTCQSDHSSRARRGLQGKDLARLLQAWSLQVGAPDPRTLSIAQIQGWVGTHYPAVLLSITPQQQAKIM